MAVFVLLVNFNGYSGDVGKQNTFQGEIGRDSFSTSGVYKSTTPPMFYYGGEQASISDTREFLKIDYNATLRTRNVNDLKK